MRPGGRGKDKTMDGYIKTALVTGADRGLGFSIARGLAEKGWRVFAGRYLEEYGLLDDLKNEYPEVYPVKLDVSKKDDMYAAREYICSAADHLDIIFSNAALMGGNGDCTVGKPINFALLEKSFLTNSLAAPLLTEVFLPLLERGQMKRLFFVSSEISSVRLQHRGGEMRYGMSKTALNLGVRMIFNTLRPKGYTFRLYQPGWMRRVMPDGSRSEGALIDPDDSAKEALRQLLTDRPDEDRLVLTDYLGNELSF